MKKHQANILVVDDDEHVTITSKMILKQYFENIDVLAFPKSLEAVTFCIACECMFAQSTANLSD